MNDADFKQELGQLDLGQQRRVGAAFVHHVLGLTADPAIEKVLGVAANAAELTKEELAAAFKSARSAVLESHARCGADSDWQAQAGYFVARAAEALVTPAGQAKSPAWDAAANARMARTSSMIGAADESMHQESEAQYRILEQFLNDI